MQIDRRTMIAGSAALLASVTTLRAEARAGDAPAAKQAVNALKPAYSKFFLKFG